MDVPDGTGFSFSHYNQTWCNVTLQRYNRSTTSGGGMTMGALAFSVVLMMLLGFTLLCSGFVRLFLGRQSLNLFLGRFNLYPAVRVLLRVTFVLFLPLLSTAFSLTKQKGGTGLLLMLLWMLLIELIRKKVQVMVLPTDGSSFTRGIGRFTLMDYADEMAHVLWAGYLVYSNINEDDNQNGTQASPGLVAMFAALWSLSLVKLVQRVVNTYLAGQSFSTARNPLLIASYMHHVIHTTTTTTTWSPTTHGSTTASAVMETCKFVVAGESKLVRKKQKETKVELIITTPRNENDLEKLVGLDMNLAEMDKLVTIDKIWKWGQDSGGPNAKLFCPKRRTDLENLCLSFSLFKMLRRRFEKYPMAEVGSAMTRRLMLKGLLNLDDDDDDGTGAHRPFKVLQLELDFLDNYYLAADNVVMSQPILFFSNFALSMIFVPIYLVAVLVILYSNGDIGFLYCTAKGLTPNTHKGPIIIYLSITLALVATLICIEFTEFLTCYLFSNWNTVRLVCLYGVQRRDRRLWRKFLYCLITLRFFVSTGLHFLAKFFFRHRADPNITKINQVSILSACGPLDKLFSAPMYQATLKTKAKKDIINSLKDIDEETGTISLPVLPHGMSRDETTGRMKSVTEIILVAHLATELFDNRHKAEEEPKDDDGSPRVVATTLSRYCMYLVAYLPAMLPDDETWVSRKLGDMRNCLAQVLQQCGGCSLCTPSSCYREKMEESLRNITMRDDLEEDLSMAQDAMKMLQLDNNSWDDLAYFWVKMLIYLAPSNDIQGHAKAVATSGGDLITYLWTFCTHAGITRCISDDDQTV